MVLYDNRYPSIVNSGKYKMIRQALSRIDEKLGYQIFYYGDYASHHSSNIIVDTDNKVIAISHDGRFPIKEDGRINSSIEPLMFIEKMFGSILRDLDLEVPQLIE